MKNKHVVVSLSGGMDSSTLLIHCLEQGMNVTALSFDYGQKHRVELERAATLVSYLSSKGYNFRYQVIKLDGLTDLLNSALVSGGEEVPEGHYAHDNMKATVVPNRNKIFSSISQAVALSIAKETNDTTYLALGIHSGDHAIYPDCRQEFRDADMDAFRIGNWDAESVEFYTPYLEGDKFTILQDGEKACDVLGIDFDTVYKHTNTSYKPIYVSPEGEVITNATPSGSSLGMWYSDYKSASSVERIEAFINLGRPDPVGYADESGPVSWETAKTHVESVLNEWESK
jgi:7-cyano-7-deazaguanine synthase